jgi:hypothetical protein
MRTEVDMRDNEWHVYHFNFRYSNVYGGIESPNYGRLYVDGVYQQGTNVIDSLGRNEWLQNIEPINTIMVGGWEWDAVPPDGNQNYGFYGDIDYVSVSREPMKQVWVEGAARAYHRTRPRLAQFRHRCRRYSPRLARPRYNVKVYFRGDLIT